MSFNEVNVSQIGHLAANPEMTYVGTDRRPRTSMVVITNKSWKDKETGEENEKATRVRWTLWGDTAENAAKYLGKGSPVAINGRFENNDYEKEGQIVYDYQHVAVEVKYLDSKAAAEARAANNGRDTAEQQ